MTTVILTTSDLDAVAEWAAASIRSGVIETVHIPESLAHAMMVKANHERGKA